MNIASVKVTYLANGGWKSISPVSYNTAYDFGGIGLPSYGNTPYMLPGDVIEVVITAYGSGNNDLPTAYLQTSVGCNDLCGYPVSNLYFAEQFFYNYNVCPPTCTANPCAGSSVNPLPLTNICNNSPMTIEPTITNNFCRMDGHGQISLHVSGGPVGYSPQTGQPIQPSLTYQWSSPGGTASSITGLSNGSYTVTVNAIGGGVTATSGEVKR